MKTSFVALCATVVFTSLPAFASDDCLVDSVRANPVVPTMIEVCVGRDDLDLSAGQPGGTWQFGGGCPGRFAMNNAGGASVWRGSSNTVVSCGTSLAAVGSAAHDAAAQLQNLTSLIDKIRDLGERAVANTADMTALLQAADGLAYNRQLYNSILAYGGVPLPIMFEEPKSRAKPVPAPVGPPLR